MRSTKKYLIVTSLILGSFLSVGGMAVLQTIMVAKAVGTPMQVLVVGGGGGGGGGSGGGARGGGGGAGGYRANNALSLVPGSYAITVGGGGAGGPSTGTSPGGTGGASSIAALLVSDGGGGGGTAVSAVSNTAATNGASGGGAGGGNCHSAHDLFGTGIAGEGNNGGHGGNTCVQDTGGGGGGSGSVGSNDPADGTHPGGNATGGIGTANSISGASVTYAAGGNGGGAASPGAAGGANTGNGGNGNIDTSVGGAGGSGIVIISYVTADWYAYTITGGTVTTSGANTIHTFTSSGTFTVTLTNVTYTIKPWAADGVDTYYGTVYGPGPNNTTPSLSFGGWGDFYYDYFKFDITNSQAAADTTDASLWVYTASAPVSNPTINLYYITAAWDQTTLTRTLNPTSTLFGAGPSPVVAGWNSSSITSLYQDWKNGVKINYGVKYTPTLNNNTAGGFVSADEPDPTYHPKLVITTGSGAIVRTDSITPYSGDMNASVTITSIAGVNFVSGAAVKLQKAGQTDITCTGFTFTSSTSLTNGNCPITGAAVGMWNLVVTNPDGSKGTLAPAFQIFNPSIPTVTTPTAASITSTTATLGANLTATGGPAITARGTCWDVTPTPVANCLAEGGTALGIFTHARTGLPPGTTIYYRGYATNSAGTGYSADGIFTTMVPTVVTSAATSVTATTATIPGTGNPNRVTATGWFRYSTTSPGTCNDTFGTRAPASGGTALGAGSTAVAFSQAITSLSGSTTYYFCAIASNSVGTGFGAVASFTTAAVVAPTVTSPTVSSVTSSTATLGANVTSNGGATLTARGTCWGTAAAPTTNCLAQGGVTTGVFTQAITGITSGVTIYYRGYATNSVGTGYSADGIFTTMPPTVVTSAASSINPMTATLNGTGNPNRVTATGWFRYSTTNPGVCDDVFGTRVPASGGTALGAGSAAVAFSQGVTSLTQTTTYYYCALASNSVGTGFGAVTSFTTTAVVVPTVTTPTAAATDVTARLGANITSDGGAGVLIARGTCWGTSVTPTTNCLDEGGTTAGIFAQGRVSLPSNTLIYYRAYATNSAGTTYSADGSFTTGTNPGVTATGGTITTFGGRNIHTFTTSGTFTVTGVTGSGNVEVMVVAGGGGGGGSMGGGGGAGGLIYNSSFNVTAQAYAVTVGAGGAGGSGSTTNATNGTNSIFSTLTATGGGAGGRYSAQAGVAGGSGGGGGAYTTAGGTGIAGQGNAGGPSGTSIWKSGGGGGAGAVGATGGSGAGNGGPGGNGSNYFFSGSSVYYAGGGGGGGYSGSCSGTAAGGLGGGGTGTCVSNGAGTAGTANTGGGGGGGGYSTGIGGTGGSGIVIISYTTSAPPTIASPTATSITSSSATLGANVTSDGGATLTARGTCWGTTATPVTNCNPEGTTATGVFTMPATGMSPNTLIYYRGYATNSAGTTYSPDGTFTTLAVAPTLTSPTVTAITISGATLGANVTSDGGATLTARGTCWGTTAAPVTNCLPDGFTTTGVFTQARSGMSAGTLIYYRGYATNSIGTGYSADGSFTTLTDPTTTAINPTSAINNVAASIASVSGTNFVSGATVKLTKAAQSDISCTGFTFTNSTTLSTGSCPITGAATGAWNVVVTNPDAQTGILTSGFTIILPAPTVSAINPTTGVNNTSASITSVSGTNFVSGATVSLSKSGQTTISCTGFVFSSSVSLTAGTCPITGATTGTWNVVVTNPDSQNNMLVNGFTINLPAPTVSSINPTTGINNTSASIASVSGTNFVSGATVKLTKAAQSDISCTGFTFTNSTTLSTGSCPITGAATGAWNVVVTNPDAQVATLSGGFTISALTTGSLTSSTYDTGFTKGVNYNSLMWKGSLGTGGVNYVTFQFAASNCPNGKTNPPTCNDTGAWTYLGPGGSTSTVYTTSGPNSPVPLNSTYSKSMRYYRYKVILQRAVTATSPVVDDVIVNWSP